MTRTIVHALDKHGHFNDTRILMQTKWSDNRFCGTMTLQTINGRAHLDGGLQGNKGNCSVILICFSLLTQSSRGLCNVALILK